jgi:hypothetical protein
MAHFAPVGPCALRNSSGWPVPVQQSDLPTKNHKLDKKLKIVLPEKHYIADPVLIALMKYLLNENINPGDTVFNHPTYSQGSRDRVWPHFKPISYAASTIGNWTQDKIKQYITHNDRIWTKDPKSHQWFFMVEIDSSGKVFLGRTIKPGMYVYPKQAYKQRKTCLKPEFQHR